MAYPIKILVDNVAAGVGLGVTRRHPCFGNLFLFAPVVVIVIVDLVDLEVLALYDDDEEGKAAALAAFRQ